MFCLTINFQSIKLNKNIIHAFDKVKVSIITYLGNEKQSFVINTNNMNCINNFVKLNIIQESKKLVFIFERKNIFQLNPMIASRTIDAKKILEFSTKLNSIEQKSFDIYKPIRFQNDVSDISSRVVRKMTIQFNITEQFYIKNSYNKLKMHDSVSYSGANQNILNENSILLLDNDFIN